MTDTGGMTRHIVSLTLALAAGLVLAAVVHAGGHCQHCGGTAAGQATPCGDSGCGPKYCGPEHWQDPCDACGRWIGCGARQSPDLLAPWQRPPGCGFVRPADLGYACPQGVCGYGAPCGACSQVGPCGGLNWLRPLVR
jgi:hypothetical protein